MHQVLPKFRTAELVKLRCSMELITAICFLRKAAKYISAIYRAAGDEPQTMLIIALCFEAARRAANGPEDGS